MRYLVKISAGLHDAPNPTAPSSAGIANVGDQVDADDIAGKDFVRAEVVEPPPRRSGWLATAALEQLPGPSPEIDALGFYTYLDISTAGTGADQRYLFALAVAESGLRNTAGTITGSDAFGPFQYTSARWAELLAAVGGDAGLQPSDRMDPFAQAILAIREESAAAATAHTALLRPVQRNELYLLHLLHGATAASFFEAINNQTTPPITAIGGDPALLSQQLKRSVQTVADALNAAADALRPGLAQSETLNPPPAPAPVPTPDLRGITRTLPLARQALARLLEAGWSKPQACGIIANIQAESSFNKNLPGDGGQAFGLCQWHPDRQGLFEQSFHHPMRPQSSFEEQIDFITFEMKSGHPSERKAGSELATATTPSAAAEKVCRFYERPKDPGRDSAIRMGLAEAYARTLT